MDDFSPAVPKGWKWTESSHSLSSRMTCQEGPFYSKVNTLYNVWDKDGVGRKKDIEKHGHHAA